MTEIINDKYIVVCKRASTRSDKWKLFSSYNVDFIDTIKALPKEGKTWHNYGEEKFWQLNTNTLYMLMKYYRGSADIHFQFDDEEKKYFLEKIMKIDQEIVEKKRIIESLERNKKLWIELKNEYEREYLKYWDLVHGKLKKDSKLYPHQVVAALFLNKTKSALLSMEMGTGKTLSGIAYVEMNDFKKVIVITPNSLKFNFYNEIEKFTDSSAYIVNWKHNKCDINDAKYIIMNYEFYNPKEESKIIAKFKKLQITEIDAVICDEAHRLKNTKSNTYKNFKKIFKGGIFGKNEISKVFLSGTPAPNRAFELYSVLNQISPIDFATKRHFYEYYCGMSYDRFSNGWSTDFGDQKLEELFHKIAPFTFRKKKVDVLTDLPDKIYQKLMLELSPKEQQQYEDIERGVATELIDNKLFTAGSVNPLTIMLRLRQYTSSLKIAGITELIDGLLNEDEKIVIVDVFKDMLYQLYDKYKDISVIHTGDQTVEERAKMVDDFQDPKSKIKIFLASVQTANYGLTLTAASNMIVLTLPFSVGEYDQVSDRLHRIGQKDTVNIYPVIYRDTIDEYVFDMVETKRTEINKVMDNEDYTSNISESVLNEVIKKIKKKYG